MFFFKTLFLAEETLGNFDFLSVIPSVLTEEDDTMLESTLSMEKVFQTIKSMDGESVMGPYGFIGDLFVKA